MRIAREELYRRVWTTPMRKLAPELGLSDVGLKKHCVKLQVPVPGRGYWAKLAAGQQVRKAQLPKLSGATPGFTEIVGPAIATQEPEELSQEGPVFDQQEFEARPEHRIVVPETLDHVFRVVRRTRTALRDRHSAKAEGRVYTWREGFLNVKVTPEQVDRATRILQALLIAFEVRGFEVSFEKDPKAHTAINVHGQKLRFRVVEIVRRETREPEKPRYRGEYVSTYRSFVWHGTGRLALEIGNEYGYSRWCGDTKRHRLEESLNDFMVDLVEAAEIERLRHEESAALQRKWAEEERQRREEELARAREDETARKLEEDASAWCRAHRIRSFVAAVENAARGQSQNDTIPAALVNWLVWARSFADRLDPTIPDNAKGLADSLTPG
jgi:hypothetical protein